MSLRGLHPPRKLVDSYYPLNPHILVAVDYVTKWVEAIPTSSVDHNISFKMLKEVIFPRFGVPRYLMTGGGSHFIHGAFQKNAC